MKAAETIILLTDLMSVLVLHCNKMPSASFTYVLELVPELVAILFPYNNHGIITSSCFTQ